MKAKKKLCDGCGEPRFIWKNTSEDGERKRYCKGCWSAQNSNRYKPTSNKKPIRSRSPKRTKQETEYNKKARKFKEKYPHCKASIPNCCTGMTHDVHHMAGRIGDLLLDETKWLPVCRSCHTWIEIHPQEARELGYSLSKL